MLKEVKHWTPGERFLAFAAHVHALVARSRVSLFERFHGRGCSSSI